MAEHFSILAPISERYRYSGNEHPTEGHIINYAYTDNPSRLVRGFSFKIGSDDHIKFDIEGQRINRQNPIITYGLEYINASTNNRISYDYDNFSEFNNKLIELGFPEFSNVYIKGDIHYRDRLSKFLEKNIIPDYSKSYKHMANVRLKSRREPHENGTNVLTAMRLASNPSRRMLEFLTPVKGLGRRTKRRKHSRRKSRRHRC